MYVRNVRVTLYNVEQILNFSMLYIQNESNEHLQYTLTRSRLCPVDSLAITLIDLRTRSNSSVATLFDLFVHHSQQPVKNLIIEIAGLQSEIPWIEIRKRS